MRFACWIPKATNTHSEHEIFVAFHGKNDVENAPQSYVYTYIVLYSYVEQLKSLSDPLQFSHLLLLLDISGCKRPLVKWCVCHLVQVLNRQVRLLCCKCFDKNLELQCPKIFLQIWELRQTKKSQTTFCCGTNALSFFLLSQLPCNNFVKTLNLVWNLWRYP